jgi:hypothetical protein
MRFAKHIFISMKGFVLTLLTLICLLFISPIAKAQEPPPRPIKVTVTAQSLSFGAFTLGVAGGTVTISSTGSRSSTGDIVLLGLGYSFSTALYQIVANPGTLISLIFNNPVTLTGSPGGTLTLNINSSDPVSPFVTTLPYPTPTSLNVGGTLTVGNLLANPPGSYTGTFDITFVQE